MDEISELLAGHRIVPVVSPRSLAEVGPLATALLSGGLPVAEVTLRRPGALDCLRAMAAVPGLLVGAGTVRTAAQLHEAVAAGARFVVSPCLTAGLAEAARSTGVPFLPGVATATEIQHAVDGGVRTVKFFPAESSGGLPALRALAEPFGDVSFVPTGGITAALAPAYLACRPVIAVGGSWLLPDALREAEAWDAVADEIRRAVALVAAS